MFVKICGITSEEDALLAVAVGADAVGFVFAPSSRQVHAQRVADIVRRLPSDVLTVGVFRNEATDRIARTVNATGIRAVQLHGDEPPSQVRAVRQEVHTVFKAVVAGSSAFDNAAEFGADAILVESASPGSGQVFDWRLAEDAPGGVSILLAGGLNPHNVEAAIRKVRPWGVDVSSGVEREPGKKDPLLVRDFVRAARAAAGEDANTDDVVIDLANEPGEPYDWQKDSTWR